MRQLTVVLKQQKSYQSWNEITLLANYGSSTIVSRILYRYYNAFKILVSMVEYKTWLERE